MPEPLLPDRSLHCREVKEVSIQHSHRGIPVVRVNFVEGGVMVLSPLVYYAAACAKNLIPPAVKDRLYGITDFETLWKACPKNPEWLIGQWIEFENRLHSHSDGYTSFIRPSFVYRRFR